MGGLKGARMKIIVTGSTGRIGHVFVRMALAAGHDLTCLGHMLTVPERIAAIDWEGCGALVHLAAAGVKRGAADRTWADCIAVNFGGTRDLLGALKASGQTPAVYIAGTVRETQTRERPDYWGDPYIVSQKLRREFVHEWAQGYAGCVFHPFIERVNEPADAAKLCTRILEDITHTL